MKNLVPLFVIIGLLLTIPSAFAAYNGKDFYHYNCSDTGSTTVIFGDAFNRSNSATVGNSWTESEGASAVAAIASEQLKITDTSGTNQVYVEHSFTGQTGKFNVSYVLRRDDDTWSTSNFIFDGATQGTFTSMMQNDATYLKKWGNEAGGWTVYGSAWTTGQNHTVRLEHDVGTDTFNYYVDDVLIGSGLSFRNAIANADKIRFLTGASHQFNSWYIDDVCIYTGALPNFSTPTPSGNPYAKVLVKDQYDNQPIQGLTVHIGTTSNTTGADGVALVNNPTGLNYTVVGNPNYFNVSGTATENATVTAYTYGAFPDVSAYDVEGTNVLIFNLTSPNTTNTTTDGSAQLLLPPNTTTDVNVTAPGFYLLESNVTTTGQDTSAKNITGLYQTIVTINATNAYTGAKLFNFTGWVYNNETGYNVTFNDTGTGTATVYALNGLHTIYIEVDGYSITSSNYDYHNYTNLTYNKTFSLYSNNSILIYIRDEADNQFITENVTVTVTGNSSETTYYTTTGSLFLENLVDGNYSIKFSSANYSLRVYEVTVADRSTQILNAFLSAATDTVTFSVIDFDNSQAIEGATVIQQRLINSTWTTIESKSSDITGRAQFTYTIGVRYRFTVTKTGYDSKIFELDPIIFTSYVIRLERDLIVDNDVGLFDVNVIYYPVEFTNNANNSFTVTFSSVGGTLETYGYNLSYPGGTQSASGSNANGGTFQNSSFAITGATFTDRVTLYYWYDSTLGGNKTYKRTFQINAVANAGTLNNAQTEDFGLGTVDKLLIATIGTLVFAGVLTLFGAPILGLAGGLFALGFFTFIGFISVWVVVTSFVVGFLLLARRSSE